MLNKGQDQPDTIGPEGVEKLCKDLGVDPEDVRAFLSLNFKNIMLVGHVCFIISLARCMCCLTQFSDDLTKLTALNLRTFVASDLFRVWLAVSSTWQVHM